MKRFILSTFGVLATAVISMNIHAAQMPAPDAAKIAADEWMSIVDSGAYDQGWELTTQTFRTKISREYWNGLMAGRSVYGQVISSRPRATRYMRSLPGFPDGEYYTFQYEILFADSSRAVETVALRREGQIWGIVTYGVVITPRSPAGLQPLSDN
jgi:hypothetical protein